MKNVVLGLALSGGASLGAYEVGVLKRFNEKGIKFDVVTGTSIGAINGSLVVTDEIEKMEKLWLSIGPEDVSKEALNVSEKYKLDYNEKNFLALVKDYTTNKGVDITPLKELCKKEIDPKKVLASKVKFGTVCCTFPNFKGHKINMHELDEEHILPFIHASSACFPVFPIEKIDDKKYIDGFYSNNLPIDFCFELGATKVIAIDLQVFHANAQNSYLLNLPNVDCITPKVDLGSFMDFRHEVIKVNMDRGYNDAKKYFNELKGYKYSFEDSEDIEIYANKFVNILTKDISNHSKMVVKFLSEDLKHKDFPITDQTSFFILALEELGNAFNIPDYLIYNHHAFFELIKSHANNIQDSNKRKTKIGRNKLSKMFEDIIENDKKPKQRINKKDKELSIFYFINKLYKSVKL